MGITVLICSKAHKGMSFWEGSNWHGFGEPTNYIHVQNYKKKKQVYLDPKDSHYWCCWRLRRISGFFWNLSIVPTIHRKKPFVSPHSTIACLYWLYLITCRSFRNISLSNGKLLLYINQQHSSVVNEWW